MSLSQSKSSFDITEFLSYMFDERSPFEIRALEVPAWQGSDKLVTQTGYFYDPVKAAKAVAAIQAKNPKAIYFTLNPVIDEIAARNLDRIKQAEKGQSTKDEQIQVRRWFLVDVDPVRPSDTSSTDAELKVALEIADRIKNDLSSDYGWPEPIQTMSGNGAGLLYRVSELNTEVSKKTFENCLIALSQKYTTPQTSIDTSVFNASQLSKVCGTTPRKGSDFRPAQLSPEKWRPHRQSWFVRPSQPLEVVTSNQLLELAAMAKQEVEPTQKTAEPKPAVSPASSFDIDEWLRVHNVPVGSPEPYQGGRKWLFTDLPIPCQSHQGGHGCDGAQFLIQRSGGVLQAGCHHQGCSWWTWQDLRKAYQTDAYLQSTNKQNQPVHGNPPDDKDEPLSDESKKIDKPKPSKAKSESKSIENFETILVENADGSESFIDQPIPILEIAKSVFDHSNGWPKRAGNDLFVLQDDSIRTLKKTTSLFAWLRESTEINWKTGSRLATKDEIFETIGNRCEQFDSVESYPHFPRIANVYYTCKDRPAGSGKYLEQFLDFFCPSSPIDRQLLLAAIVTTFWGGAPGGRPAFQFSATTGQGAGKTTTASTIAKLAGGSIDFDQSAKREEITKRLLNGETTGRVVFLDNIKAQTFSSASFESLITAKEISGHQMYAGNTSKPNHFTFFITFNSPSFSRDMAQRLVTIVLGDSTKKASWQNDVDEFIESHRLDVIDDVKAFFDRPKTKLSKYNRWANWQAEIISRLDNPEAIIYELAMRESSNDSDAKMASDIIDHSSDYFEQYGYKTPYCIHVPFKELRTIVNESVGSLHSEREAGLLIDRLIACNLIFNASRNPSHKKGKGFLFWSADGESSSVQYDLAERVENREVELDNAREERRTEVREKTRDTLRGLTKS